MGLRQGDWNDRISGIWRAWRPILAVTATVIVLGVFGDAARELLAFDRAGIASGDLWRIVTGHFVHLGPSHLVLNLAGLALVWFLVGRAYSPGAWIATWLLSIVAVSAGLWWFEPQLAWYVGLSGVLHGLLAAGLIGTLDNRAEVWILGLALIGKLAWEQLFGPLPGSETTSGGNVIVDAHLFGALGGVLAAVLIRVRAKASI